MRADKRSAFSVLEAIIVLTFIAVIAAIAVPRLNFAVISKQRAECAARKIVTDLHRTRQLAIAHAAGNAKGFAMRMVDSAPYTSYQIVNLDAEVTVDQHTMDSKISCTGGPTFEFGPLGNLEPGSDTQLTVSAEGKTFTITIIPATGAIKCVEN
jgi:type II secretory pathway pseudopilin PulG